MDYDLQFLKTLDSQRLRTQYAKIILLSFDEKPISEIQGTITNGTLSVNGSAAIRRTISLTMRVNEEDIENIDNIISLNKKIKVSVGYKNPVKDSKYEDIIWFPCGVFIINNATSSRSTSGWNVSIQGKDKMAMLDGSAGGTFPASVTFHEAYIEDANTKDIEIVYPTIYEIIQEAVVHYGGENINNVFINDVPATAKLLLKWNGSEPLYVDTTYGTMTLTRTEGYQEFTTGDDVCYEETPFTYPGELILNAGENVVTLLDKISKTLGNFEFFYDIDGRFIFQQKKNFLDIQSPLLELENKDYLSDYSNEATIWEFDNLESVMSLNKNPKYENIKNDYVVLGVRTTATGGERGIRYHLAIDVKPMLNKCLMYMFDVHTPNIEDGEEVIKGTTIRYEFSYNEDIDVEDGFEATLISVPCQEWREELYRNALQAQYTTGYYSYYDQELIAEWRKLYDPTNADWEDGWNPAVKKDPRELDYWLDFIDSAELLPYSVNKIGRRSKIANENSIKSIMNQRVPDILVLRAANYNTEEDLKNAMAYYNSLGQKICVLRGNDEIDINLILSSTGASAFDKIRDLLYQHLSYNTTLALTCLPKYHFEPNNLIYIYDEKSHLNNNYAITQFSLPLGHSGTMSITATEALRRL